MKFRHISKARECPVCKSREVYRVKRTGFAVKAVCQILDLRPHWCENCDTFFLAPSHSKLAHHPKQAFDATTSAQAGGEEPPPRSFAHRA